MIFEKCSNSQCKNSVTTRPVFPITSQEKKHGLLCGSCLKDFWKGANFCVCLRCNSIVRMFYFEERKTKRQEFFVEKCRNCNGDIMDEKDMFSKKYLFFKNIKNKFKSWLKIVV